MSAWQPIQSDELVIGDVIAIRRHYGSGAGHPASTIQLAGRVVSASKGSLWVEWTTLTGSAPFPPKPHRDEPLTRDELSRCRLRHMPSQSPTERTNAAGRAMMRELLRTACRDDMRILAACRDPETGVLLGSDAANALLEGKATIREWHIRQCDGRLQRPRFVRSQHADPEVLAIMRAFPGAQVREVRLRASADESMDDEDREPAA